MPLNTAQCLILSDIMAKFGTWTPESLHSTTTPVPLAKAASTKSTPSPAAQPSDSSSNKSDTSPLTAGPVYQYDWLVYRLIGSGSTKRLLMQMATGQWYEFSSRVNDTEGHRIAAAFATELKGCPTLLAELLSEAELAERGIRPKIE